MNTELYEQSKTSSVLLLRKELEKEQKLQLLLSTNLKSQYKLTNTPILANSVREF